MTTPRHPTSTAAASNTADDLGVTGNSRLTSATGILLLVMLAVEGYTVLDVRGLITLHIFLGVMLVGPVLLKIASTSYRFVRYYSGRQAYVRKGAPNIVLRVLGPFVTVSSIALLATGIALLAVHPGEEGILLTAHKASFIIWFGVMAIHVLGHLREAFVNAWEEIRQFSFRQLLRLGALVVALAIGVGLATALMPTAHPWTHRDHSSQERDR